MLESMLQDFNSLEICKRKIDCNNAIRFQISYNYTGMYYIGYNNEYKLHCLFNMEFLTYIRHSDSVGDGVETWLITGLITGLISAGINVVRLQFIGDM